MISHNSTTFFVRLGDKTVQGNEDVGAALCSGSAKWHPSTCSQYPLWHAQHFVRFFWLLFACAYYFMELSVMNPRLNWSIIYDSKVNIVRHSLHYFFPRYITSHLCTQCSVFIFAHSVLWDQILLFSYAIDMAFDYWLQCSIVCKL